MANLDRRVSAARLEVLTSAAQVVVPRGLPAGGEFPTPKAADWVNQIRLETTWRTDVTRSTGSNAEERRQLLTRPVRTQTATLTGRDNDETHIIAQAVLAHAGRVSPVPIYCDQMPVVAASGATIFCDTRFRRLAIGQRVAIISPGSKLNDDYFQFGIVQEVQADRVVLEQVPSTAPTSSSVVYPCMDAEMVTSASGSFITDGILQVTITWEEVVGQESIPPSYPPFYFDNLEGLVGYTGDGLPIFDFPPDWSEGLRVTVERRGRRSPVGTSSVFDPQGAPVHSFDLAFLSSERREHWNILRFFDAMQGRTGSFFFLNPMQGWEIANWVNNSEVKLVEVGNPQNVEAFYNKVAFIRSNGEVFVRDIDRIQETGGFFNIELTAALPDQNFAEVKPAHLCRLKNDTLNESWNTDEVVTSSVVLTEIREDDKIEALNAQGQPTESELYLETYRTKSKTAISDPHHWFSALSNTYTSDGLPASVWPSRDYIAHQIYDVRERAIDLRDPERPSMLPSQTSLSPLMPLMSFTSRFQNNGMRGVLSPDYCITSLDNRYNSQIPVDQRHLWGTDGFTMMLCFTPFTRQVVTSGTYAVFRLTGTPGIILSLDVNLGTGVCSVFYRRQNGVTAAPNLQLNYRDTYTVLVTLRWDPATQKLHTWVGGEEGFASPGYVSNVDALYVDSAGAYGTAIGTAMHLGGLFTAFPSYAVTLSTEYPAYDIEGFINDFGKFGCFNSLLTWKRPLSLQEMNDIGGELAETYNIDLQTINSIP